MSNLGFKQLSTENWLMPDDFMQGFGRFASDGSIHDISGEEWLRDILQPQIDDTVPLEVKKLFEVARGAMAYGYFFYPLYTLGIEQLWRVAEAAVTHKCRAMKNVPGSASKFYEKVEWLIEEGVIPKNEALRWTGIRKLRNLSSHPEMQSIYMPLEALKFIESIAKHVNSLFVGA